MHELFGDQTEEGKMLTTPAHCIGPEHCEDKVKVPEDNGLATKVKQNPSLCCCLFPMICIS